MGNRHRVQYMLTEEDLGFAQFTSRHVYSGIKNGQSFPVDPLATIFCSCILQLASALFCISFHGFLKHAKLLNELWDKRILSVRPLTYRTAAS